MAMSGDITCGDNPELVAMSGDIKCGDNPDLSKNVDGNYEFEVDVPPKMNNSEWIHEF